MIITIANKSTKQQAIPMKIHGHKIMIIYTHRLVQEKVTNNIDINAPIARYVNVYKNVIYNSYYNQYNLNNTASSLFLKYKKYL